jgi:hypothetical protein
MDPLRGSIAWLRSMTVIDADDEKAILAATNHRNAIAHDLMGLMAGLATPDYMEAVPPVYNLISKIERWWIVNVHMDLCEQELPEGAELQEVVPGPILSLQMLVQVAMAEGDSAWDLHRVFQTAWPMPKTE